MATIKKAQEGRKMLKAAGEAAGKAISKAAPKPFKSKADSVGKERSDDLYELSKKRPKAKDGKWIQKAVNPKHKGYCTPMTKATCTPKRKALAKTFKKMAQARKGK